MESFFVRGKPVPQGSMKFIRPGVMIHSRSQDLSLWRADIARNAELNGCVRLTGGVSFEVTFVFEKPKSATRPAPWVKPDLDKLIRAVLDGLTGIAYEDDCQVIHIVTRKIYGSVAGAWIGVSSYANSATT